jgi:hypothetical protein
LFGSALVTNPQANNFTSYSALAFEDNISSQRHTHTTLIAKMKVIQNSPDGDSLPLNPPPLRESKTSMIRNGSPDEEKLIENQNSSPRGQHSELFSKLGSFSKVNATSGHGISIYVKSNHESDSEDGNGTSYDESTGSDRTDNEDEATIFALFPKLPMSS